MKKLENEKNLDFENLQIFKDRLTRSSIKLKKSYNKLVKVHLNLEKYKLEKEIFQEKIEIFEISRTGRVYKRQLFYPNILEIYTATALILSNTSISEFSNFEKSQNFSIPKRDLYLVEHNGLSDLIGYSQKLSN